MNEIDWKARAEAAEAHLASLRALGDLRKLSDTFLMGEEKGSGDRQTINGPQCGAAPLAQADQGGEPSIQDRIWRAVDVLGAPDTACTTPEELAYCRGIGDALVEIEKLGGRWS